MPDPSDPIIIPEEILRSERKQKSPVRASSPDVLGLPGLPPGVLDWVVHIAPTIALLLGIYGLINGLGALFGQRSPAEFSQFGAVLIVGGSAAILASYNLLRQKRRTGWNILAFALIFQLAGQLLVTDSSSILFTGAQVLVTAYIMLQLRDAYSG